MRRREFLGLLACGAAWPLAAHAQQPDRVRRIGLLFGLSERDSESQRRIAALAQALRDRGWSEGQNIVIEAHYADGNPERLPALAAALVQAKVDLIVTQGAQPLEAARHATTTIPIVMASVGNALGAGYVASLAHPGGNITGQTLFATEQSTKRLQLIKEIFPALARVAVLWNGDASGHRMQISEMKAAAPPLAMVLQSLPARSAGEIDAALETAVHGAAQAIVTMDDPLIQSNRFRIVDFALAHRLPVMGEFRPMTEAGGLMSYGPNQIEMYRRAAYFVDRILNGGKPADLPVEQPSKFELVVNLKTAKALGLAIGEPFLLRADEVIE